MKTKDNLREEGARTPNTQELPAVVQENAALLIQTREALEQSLALSQKLLSIFSERSKYIQDIQHRFYLLSKEEKQAALERIWRMYFTKQEKQILHVFCPTVLFSHTALNGKIWYLAVMHRVVHFEGRIFCKRHGSNQSTFSLSSSHLFL